MRVGNVNERTGRTGADAQRGFSLVEIMVAMVASLIVVGSVLAFTVSTVQSNTENVQATRLSQDLRAVMSLMTRELRRAGYDEESLDGVGRGVDYISPFSQMEVVADVDNGCFTIAYDRAGGSPGGVEANEIRVYRRTVSNNGVGILQLGTGASPSCQSADEWVDLTDPQLTNVESLKLTLTEGQTGGTTTPLRVRDVGIVLRGSVVGRAEIVRSLETRVRVRADCIRTDLATCNTAPAP